MFREGIGEQYSVNYLLEEEEYSQQCKADVGGGGGGTHKFWIGVCSEGS